MGPWPNGGEDLLTLLSESTASCTRVRDGGTLVAAATRPHAALAGEPCYRNAVLQAASLLHAIIVWKPLELWNSGLAWTSVRAFLERCDLPLAMPPKDRLELTDDIIAGRVTDVRDIAKRLTPYLRTW
jgi:death-on-curing protein